LGEKIEIYKFKVTVFMAIIAAVGFMVVNSAKFLKFLNSFGFVYYVIIFLLAFYGTIGFIKNMNKLSLLEKEIEWLQVQ